MEEEKKRKVLSFDMSNKEEENAYVMLEKIRYFQTKFVTKIINDFFQSKNITSETPYFIIRKIVSDYIEEEATSLKSSTLLEEDILTMVANLYVSQKGMPLIPTPSSEEKPTLKENPSANEVINKTDEGTHITTNTVQPEYDDMDDDDNDDDNPGIKQMAFGFQSLVE